MIPGLTNSKIIFTGYSAINSNKPYALAFDGTAPDAPFRQLYHVIHPTTGGHFLAAFAIMLAILEFENIIPHYSPHINL